MSADPHHHPPLRDADPAVAEIFARELRRQQETLELIASENHVSRAVMEAAGSIFTNKYAEGYPGRRYYGGCENMDAVESLAIERAKKLFGCDHANVQPHSGSQANQAVFLAAMRPGSPLTEAEQKAKNPDQPVRTPGDLVLSLHLDHGGHLSHGKNVNVSGKWFRVIHYGVDAKTERIDMDQVARLAREHKPRLIITGASAYARVWEWDRFAQIAADVGALLMADIAHIAGLVAAGLHPSPAPVCPFVTTTTHKTLRGPRAGLTMCKAEWAKKIDSAVFPGLQGGPLMHVIAAKAVAFGEALRPEFKAYQQLIVDDARALAEALMSRGFRLVSGGTDNHLMMVDLRQSHPDVSGAMAEKWLENAGIIVNKNMIPFDQRKPMETSGLRIGTPAVATRGLRPEHMAAVADLIQRVIAGGGDDKTTQQVRGEVRAICAQFPLYKD
ncbi:MAG: serine hydroxymethyltransferase [Phycisphaerae bacterium]|nr:serine hydroxymethyltransferase [Phycisphaerae bacterium]NUQ44884.1 serine hydroxymethyltransferase [Phycisphaerae bacterium]